MKETDGVPAISGAMLRFFRLIVRRYLRRGFHGVRVRGGERLAGVTGPLIVYANHGSWWDPMLSILLAEKMLPGRRHYAPIDAQALKRYAILGKVGLFGVEMESARGAVRFLRTGATIVGGGGVLWVTPQGRFVDARVRPLGFRPGLAALAARVGEGCTVLPLAIEYTFWDERTPECLAVFGEAVKVGAGETADALGIRLEGALGDTMEELKGLAVAREPGVFETVVSGTAGAGGFYAVGQRLKAWGRGQRYRAEHTVRER
jgi:1-acyl-sn-glycerol-3-phosphate acyltransferase